MLMPLYVYIRLTLGSQSNIIILVQKKGGILYEASF